jgi:hypothetical protein
MEPKLVIVMRRDLGMRRGEVIALVAHAGMLWLDHDYCLGPWLDPQVLEDSDHMARRTVLRGKIQAILGRDGLPPREDRRRDLRARQQIRRRHGPRILRPVPEVRQTLGSN